MARNIPLKYVLFLFASAFMVSAAAITYHFQAMEDKMELVEELSADTRAEMIAHLEGAIRDVTKLNQKRLDDDSKERFRCVLPLFDVAAECRRQYQKAVEGNYSSGRLYWFGGAPAPEEHFIEASIAESRALAQAASKLLETNGNDFDLRPEESQLRITYYKEGAENFTRAKYEQYSKLPRAVATDLVYLDLLNYQLNLLYDVTTLTTSRVISCDAFFPVFSAESSYLMPGDFLRAKVSVGSYSTSLDPQNVVLRVNGEELQFREDGTADFSKVAKGSGRHVLKTEVRVTNPLTGKVTMGEGRFTYQVH